MSDAPQQPRQSPRARDGVSSHPPSWPAGDRIDEAFEEIQPEPEPLYDELFPRDDAAPETDESGEPEPAYDAIDRAGAVEPLDLSAIEGEEAFGEPLTDAGMFVAEPEPEGPIDPPGDWSVPAPPTAPMPTPWEAPVAESPGGTLDDFLERAAEAEQAATAAPVPLADEVVAGVQAADAEPLVDAPFDLDEPLPSPIEEAPLDLEELARGENEEPVDPVAAQPVADSRQPPEARSVAEPAGPDAGRSPPAATEPEPSYVGGAVHPPPGRLKAIPAARRIRRRSRHELAQLWGSLFFSLDRASPSVVVLTSALRGEGVTEVAIGLAMAGAAAQRDRRVALVDANLRHPRIASLLGLPNTPGLAEVLAGRVRLEHAVRPLIVEDGGEPLCVLTAGEVTSQSAAALQGRQWSSLLAELHERFDHVLLDAAAANLYQDAQTLGASADGAVLVVRAGKTPREAVGEAKRRLERAEATVLGVVLNRRTYALPAALHRER